MAVNGKAFHDLASRIHRKNLTREEICHRCSINRAYYGAYHVAAIYVGIDTTRKGIKHQDVIDKLKGCSSLGYILDKLFINRWEADYNLSRRITKDDAERVIKDAEKIINELDHVH